VEPRIRTLVQVEGVVQGVGFRPFVYSLATRLGLAGHVGNDSAGVFIEIHRPPAAALDFLSSLEQDASHRDCNSGPPSAAEVRDAWNIGYVSVSRLSATIARNRYTK
jgi:acylphosphatase